MRMRVPSRRRSKETPERRFGWAEALFLAVVGTSLFLNTLGFGWGMDGYVPWSADAIEGITVVREMPRLFGEWTYKYPRLQFLIDGLCYKPFIHSWEDDPVYVQNQGQVQGHVLTRSRLNTLATISRVNILAMSAGTLVVVYLMARFAYADSIAGLFASLSLAVMMVFVHYSHTSCVDIPSMLWITLGAYFLLKSVVLNRMGPHLWMGAAFALACCTKDAMLFYAAAFAAVYVVLRVHHLREEGLGLRACLPSLFNRNVWLALAVFVFVFALLQGILSSPKAYWDRMGVWVWGRGVKDFNKDFTGQAALLWGTLKQFYSAAGWPLLAMFLISLVATFRRRGLFHLAVVLFPLMAFYVMVSMRIKMSYIRYYLPVMGLCCLPIGAFVSQLLALRAKSLARAAIVLVGVAYGLSLMGCLALDLELIHDSRVQAVTWFEKNVEKGTPALSLIQRIYGPKLTQAGYSVIENWEVPPLPRLLENSKSLPEVVILSDGWPNLLSKEADQYKEALLQGKAGYSEVTEFNTLGYDDPHRSILAIASWPRLPRFETVSPRIIVMKKDVSGPGAGSLSGSH